MNADVRLALGLVLLLAIALTALTIAGVAQRRAVATASLRAVVQLTVVAAALRGVFAAPITVIAAVGVMFAVAVWTATRRLHELTGAASAVLLACGGGAGVAIGIVVGLPVLTRDVRTLVAVSGIVIGGTMTAATLTGRRLAEGLHRRREEIEAWLSIGATPREAIRLGVRGTGPRPRPDKDRRTGHAAWRLRRSTARRCQRIAGCALPDRRARGASLCTGHHVDDSGLAARCPHCPAAIP
jgi:ABC-type iron transport system FetAB permease component